MIATIAALRVECAVCDRTFLKEDDSRARKTISHKELEGLLNVLSRAWINFEGSLADLSKAFKTSGQCMPSRAVLLLLDSLSGKRGKSRAKCKIAAQKRLPRARAFKGSSCKSFNTSNASCQIFQLRATDAQGQRSQARTWLPRGRGIY